MDVLEAWSSMLLQWDELVADEDSYNKQTETLATYPSTVWPLAVTATIRAQVPRLFVEEVRVDQSGTFEVPFRKADVLVGLLPPFAVDGVGLLMATTPLRCNPECKRHTIDCRSGAAQLIMHPYCIPVVTFVPGWALLVLEAPAGSILRLVYSTWPAAARRHIAYGTWATGHCQYKNGMFQLCETSNAPQLPSWRSWDRITQASGFELVARQPAVTVTA